MSPKTTEIEIRLADLPEVEAALRQAAGELGRYRLVLARIRDEAEWKGFDDIATMAHAALASPPVLKDDPLRRLREP